MIILTASSIGEFFQESPLNVVFAASLFIGVVYAAFVLFFHGIGDVLGDFHFDIDAHGALGGLHLIDPHGAHEATGVSTLAIASFVSSFGAFGLIAVTLFGAGAIASLFTALFGGVIIGIAGQVFFLYILSPTISSEVRQTKLIGMVAEITTPIPANGVGQIAFVAEGSRVTYSARATSESLAVERGTPVRIERIVGGMAYVAPIH
jgi:membrane protein implicated in regulation of membrane protease activity